MKPQQPKRVTNALKHTQHAFEYGFRTALRGDASAPEQYDNPLYIAAYQRGYRRAVEIKNKEK
jgi:hypothetical protein